MDNQKREILDTAKAYIERLIIGTNEAVECFQCGKEERGYEMISLIAEGVGYILEVVVVLGINISSIGNIENLNERLNEMIEAMDSKDDILISDIIKYEIIPVIENVKIVLSDVE